MCRRRPVKSVPQSIAMRITLILLLLIVSGSQTFSQTVDKSKINQKDANELKFGWWKIHNTEGKFVGYSEGQLVEEGEYVNNKKSGVWTKYYPNGNKKHELTFTNNVANGYARIYYRDGKLQEEGIWQQNKWSGQYKYYHENGNVKYDWNYNSSGKREGEQKYFHANGMLQYLGDWKNGNEAGQLVEYYEDGSVKTKRYFNDGKIDETKTQESVQGKVFDENIKKYSGKAQPKPMGRGEIVDGFNRLYNGDGTVSKEGEFKNKQLIDGKAFVYQNGKLVKTLVFKGGVQVAE